MKKNLKKLRISKETLLPLESHQLREVVGQAVTDVVHIDFPAADATKHGHVNVALEA